jgi:hypothetical protein
VFSFGNIAQLDVSAMFLKRHLLAEVLGGGS